jgi:hypothetical protein
MVSKRKEISKKTRFEVFKRDGFVCQYCGQHPPQVVLHVDHIVAVAEGGENDMDNLVTACSTCNLGKGARSLEGVPKSLADRAAEVQEREEQLAGYGAIMEAARQRRDAETWRVIEALVGDAPRFSEKQFMSIQRFIDRLGLFEVLDAADVTRARFGGLRLSRVNAIADSPFRYFCGVCWTKIKRAEEDAF